MGFENVLYEINDGILYLTLNRPEARNALTPGMWKDIQAAVEMARFDDNIKVVIVSGSGGKANGTTVVADNGAKQVKVSVTVG